MTKFLEDAHTFKEYQKQIKNNRGVLNLINYEEQRVIKFGMFELHCDELIRALSKRVESIITQYIDKMRVEHLTATEELCSDFEVIARRAMTTPKDTHELLELAEEIKVGLPENGARNMTPKM